MKISSLAVLFLSTIAIVDAKNLRNQRAALATTEDVSVEDTVAGLEGAAKAARYEASFLEAVANRDDLDAKTKALIQAAAASAKYEASILEQAAIGNDSAKERLLKDKTLPNGGMCAYCPDDDDFVWPPTGYWTGKRNLEVEDADTERLLKDKKLPSGGMCAYCPDDDDFVWPPTGYWTGKRKLEEKKGTEEMKA